MLPDIANEELEEIASSFASVEILFNLTRGQEMTVVGSLRSVLFDAEPELEIAVQFVEAFELASVRSDIIDISKIELQSADIKFVLGGTHVIKAWRIQEIDISTQMCVIAMSLRKS
jgi:hypothetical protein